jgi:hypothetical protein
MPSVPSLFAQRSKEPVGLPTKDPKAIEPFIQHCPWYSQLTIDNYKKGKPTPIPDGDWVSFELTKEASQT